MGPHIEIHHRKIGRGHPTYIIAEISANHTQDYNKAVKLIEVAKGAGADAVKLQTYTPDTMTIDCNNTHFRIKGTPWKGRTLYELYGEAYTPWDWQPGLKKIAEDLGIDFFSTPFDETAVTFLETLDVPVYKIASFESVDIPLLRRVAETGKPVIMSTGMATCAEINEAVETLRNGGNHQLALLKCTSAYPAPPEEMNLTTIHDMAERFGVPVGLSDHTLSTTIPVASLALGTCIIEKHLTLDREYPGPDSAFSLEPDEFRVMVSAIRTTEKALGCVTYGTSAREAESRIFRRSLFLVEDVKKGETFSRKNVRSIRPGNGLHTRYLGEIIGQPASRDIRRGTPLAWDLVEGGAM